MSRPIMSRPIIVTFAVVAAFLAYSAQAATLTYTTSLNSAAENNPANTSPGTGTATVTLDTTAKTLAVNVQFGGLQGTTTAAHFHCCSLPAGSAIVAVGSPSLPLFPLGVPQGTYVNTIDLTLTSNYGAQFLANSGGTAAGAYDAFLAGLDGDLVYLNIHSNLFSAGEIRGQLAPVPLPGAFPLLLTALSVAGFRFSRRKRHRQH